MFFNKFFAKKKIILMVDGGFCSQLDKYFIGKLLEDRFQVKVKYCLTWFKKNGKSVDGKNNRNFDLLKVFPDIKFPVATEDEIKFHKKNFYYYNEKPFVYNEKLLTKKLPLYVDGYFGHWKYLKEIEEKGYNNLDFKLNLSDKNKAILEKIENNGTSVGLHIRRGDYVGSMHDVLTKDYFINAINYIKQLLAPQNPKFFIFSNGFDWVKENIIPFLPSDIDFEFVEDNNEDAGYYDFYLISKCKHQITSNSFFGYLGAFLNKNKEKKVIIPLNWTKDDKLSINDCKVKNHDVAMHYPGWIVMDNEGSVL
jgi:hypothetical protein